MTYEEAEALIREHMDYGGNVKVADLAKALSTSTLTFHQAAVAALEAATKSLNAAGASEGQAEPVAWMTEGKYPSPRFIIGNTDPSGVWKEQYVPLYLHPSAELTALRERIAGMEKDAERYRWLVDGGYKGEVVHPSVYESFVDGSREFVDAAIDAAMKEPK